MIERSIFNVKKITLMLGTACNFNCIYCAQHEDRPRFKKQLKPAVLEWLDEMAFQLPRQFKPDVQFYGGEPLLYKDSIHTVIDRFGDAFNYTVVSNGSYLTQEDVDYFNEHNVMFVYSNDGPNTCITRQIDLWKDEDFVTLFNQINRRGVDAVYSAMTQDLYKLYEYIHEKSPDTPVYHEDLITNSLTKDCLVDFDIPTLLANYKKMGDDLVLHWAGGPKTQATVTWHGWVQSACQTIKQPVFPMFGTCGTGCSRVNVDTEGNVYLCKNFSLKIGTVADDYATLYDRAKEATKQLRDKNLEAKGCFECSAFVFCKGGCPFEEASDFQKRKCDMLRTRWASVVSFIDNKMEIIEK